MSSREAEVLKLLEEQGNKRELCDVTCEGTNLVWQGRCYVNLSSNDYLGLSAERSLQKQFLSELDDSTFVMSNPSSRLMTGNSSDYEQLEQAIGRLYGGRAVLVLGSGFLLNSGVLAALAGEGDLVVADRLMHASLIDGMRLSAARWERFRHNDMEHLEQILIKSQGRYNRVIVATESLFSMDGDFAPLDRIESLRAQYGFKLYLDEAHAFGVYGSQGTGLADHTRVDYLVATLGKAACSQGAFIVSDDLTRELLINKMRTLIFSTALPPISLRWSRFIIERFGQFDLRRQHLMRMVSILGGESQIIPIPCGDNHVALERAAMLREAGFWATAIRHPTVPEGTARLRISLTAAHTISQIEQLCRLLG